MIAYVGSDRVQGDQINIHLDLSFDQNQADTDTIRTFKVEGDRLTLTSPPQTNPFLKDQTTIATVVYERVK